MRQNIYYSVNDVIELLGVSQSKAYEIIRNLNSELDRQGFLILRGKVSKAFFDEKWYGGTK